LFSTEEKQNEIGEDDESDVPRGRYSLRENRPAFETPRKKSGGTSGGCFFLSLLCVHLLSGGRKRATDEQKREKEEKAEHWLNCINSPEAVEQRVKTRKFNATHNAILESSRVYKNDHGIGDRSKVVLKEVKVYPNTCGRFEDDLRCSTKSLPDKDMHTFMSDNELAWLYDFVRNSGTTSDRSLFVDDFRSAFEEQFQKKVSRDVMLICLHGLGFSFKKLKPEYHKKKWMDEKNVKRRQKLVRLLSYLYRHKGKVIIWNFDESTFYVADYAPFGWVEEGGEFVSWVMENNQKGERVNVAAFISDLGEVLVDDFCEQYVGICDKKADAEIVAEVFRWAAVEVKKRYPNHFHVFVTDSPNVHCMMAEDACNPNNINMGDGGVNRGEDRLFGKKGFTRIYAEDEVLKHVNTEGWKKEDFCAHLWKDARVKAQPFLLEEIL
jgi:hypothetical protein